MPCSVSSATGRCSSGVAASTSVRCCLPGRSRFGFGRCGTSGGGVKCGRWRPAVVAARAAGPPPLTTLAPLGAIPVAPAIPGPPVAVAAGRGDRHRRAIAAVAVAITARAPRAVAAPAGRAVLDDGLEALLARQQLEQPGARADFSLGGTTDRTRMPSMSCSVSTRS